MLVFVELFFSLMCTSIHSMQHLSCSCPNILRFQLIWSSRTVPDEILSSLDKFSIISDIFLFVCSNPSLWHFLNQACQSHIFIVVMCSSFMLGAWIICLWSSVRVHLSCWGSYSKLSIFNQIMWHMGLYYFEGIPSFAIRALQLWCHIRIWLKGAPLIIFLYPPVKICH